MLDFLNFNRQKYSEKIKKRVRQGTSIDELSIKPTSLLMADYYNLLVEKQSSDNIDNWETQTEEQIDTFGGKFFYPRVVGGYAFGIVRVWLNEMIDVYITDTFRASTADSLQYRVTSPKKISKNSLKTSSDNNGRYYFDIGVTAINRGDDYNVVANSIQSISGVDFTYSYATNPKDMVGGAIHENNEQYAMRLRYSVNDRSLANKRSLYAGLKDEFPYIYSMYVAGAGDRYMTRDRVQAIDLSNPPKEAKFLGKISGDNIIKHSAYYAVYPGMPGSRQEQGSLSTYSLWAYPQTVEAVDLANSDPAYHGYPLYQEATDEMYRGLYYDDYRNFMNISTPDLFNITDGVISSVPIVQPDSDWKIGFNGRPVGDYGSADNDKLNIVYFQDADIVFKGNIQNSIVVSKDIKKRVGFKATGTIKTPSEPNGEYMQFMFGGAPAYNSDGTEIIDGFSGFGFGVAINGALEDSGNNAIVYFSNARELNSYIVFAQDDLVFGELGTLKEESIRLALDSEYNFEYVFYDDLSMSLIMSPVVSNPDLGDNMLTATPEGQPLTIDSSVLKPYQNAINNESSTQYGSYMRLALNSKSTNADSTWIVSGLKVVDLAPHRPTAMYMFNVDGLEEPISLVFRGNGVGAVNKITRSGHSVYIWNIENKGRISGNSVLLSGGWQKLDDVSDPEGVKDSVSAAFTQSLSNIDRYVVNTRYGKVIMFMVVCEGQSYASIENEGGAYNADVNASLIIDYIKLQDQQIDVYRANNKCDIYVTTVKNTDNLRSVSKSIERASSYPYFEISESTGFEMPIVSIDAIIDNATGSALLQGDYSIVRTNSSFVNSTKDEFLISAPGFTDVTIEYSTYNDLLSIQDFFEGEEYGKPFGDVLIKHKYPTFLDMSINYYGIKTEDEISEIIRQYFDDNINTIFDISALVSFLYSNQHVNYIAQPVVVNYETLLDNGRIETGSIITTKTIRPIDFFRIRTLTVNQVSA